MTVEHLDLAPATGMQEALWWIHQRTRDKSVYNLTWRLSCDGRVDAAALSSAWQAMADRHDSLRGFLRRVGDQLEFAAPPALEVSIRRIDIEDPGELEPATLLRLLAEEVQVEPMDLATPGLARLTLIRVADVQELLITAHHAITDGWGMQLLLGELSEAYRMAANGERPAFAAAPVAFLEYARQQRAAITSPSGQASLDYWSSYLDGAMASTVAADKHGEFASGSEGRVLTYAFSEDAGAGIAALGKLVYATPFATVLAALSIVLSRGGAGPDVTVGIAVANRMTAQEQNLVGYTANLCVGRTRIEPDDAVIDVVTRCRDSMWQMLAHQSVPYPVVYAALNDQTQQRLSDTPPVMLSYLGGIGEGLTLGDVGLRRYPSPNRAARADISIAFWPGEDGYLAEVEYNTGRYLPETVLALLHDLDAVLAAAGDAPDSKVMELTVSSQTLPSELDHHREQTPAGAPAVLPTSAGWQQVSQAWTEILGAPPAGPDADFFDAGGNSLRVVRLGAVVAETTGVDLDLIGWLAEPTPRKAVDQLTGQRRPVAESVGDAVLTLAEGSGTHLHLLPGAGATAQDYRELASALPAGWKVTVSVEGERSPEGAGPPATVPEMARWYRADLEALGLRPDLIGGWSLGGQLAYELVADYPDPKPALVIVDATPPTGAAATLLSEMDSLRTALATFAAAICESMGLTGRFSLPDTHGDPRLASAALGALLSAAGQPIPTTLLHTRWQAYLRHVGAVLSYVRVEQVDTRALLVGAELVDEQLDQWANLASHPALMRLKATHNGVLRGIACRELAAGITQFAAAGAAHQAGAEASSLAQAGTRPAAS